MVSVEDGSLQFFVGGYNNPSLHHPDPVLKGRLLTLFPLFHQGLMRVLMID